MLNDLTPNLQRDGSNIFSVEDKWSPFTANFHYGKDKRNREIWHHIPHLGIFLTTVRGKCQLL